MCQLLTEQFYLKDIRWWPKLSHVLHRSPCQDHNTPERLDNIIREEFEFALTSVSTNINWHSSHSTIKRAEECLCWLLQPFRPRLGTSVRYLNQLHLDHFPAKQGTWDRPTTEKDWAWLAALCFSNSRYWLIVLLINSCGLCIDKEAALVAVGSSVRPWPLPPS